MVQTLLLQCDCGPNIVVAWAMSQTPMIKKSGYCTEGLGLAVGGACLLLLLLGSSPHVHVCHPRGALHAHWVCRVFSGPWD